MTKIVTALALALAVMAAVPASAAPRGDTEHTCGYPGYEYDSSGATVGPYYHRRRRMALPRVGAFVAAEHGSGNRTCCAPPEPSPRERERGREGGARSCFGKTGG